MNYMQAMGEHYRTIRGSYEPFKGIDIASIRQQQAQEIMDLNKDQDGKKKRKKTETQQM